ncbi:MAG: fructosamine kinase family protein [Melioribacteraceae bacterium]|nr:fructosamine kinase family protein [Melioribacteraceae bacterium]
MNSLAKIESFLDDKIINTNSLGGGCIGNSQKIQTAKGKLYFLKSYPDTSSAILQNEANGLIELKKSRVIKIPEVIYFDDEYLLLEFITTGKRKNNFSEIFGKQFAKMHKCTSNKFGFFEDNFIGASIQKNQPYYNNWTEFYFNNRLLFQIKFAEQNGYLTSELRSQFNKLESKIDKILSGSDEQPSLLHGDLWSGNFMVAENGEPVLIDPAVYYGHREADLGMTHLFGGFDSSFYKAYNETFPLPDGYEYRINIYKLYHVLNHLNLFGSGYYPQAISLINFYI